MTTPVDQKQDTPATTSPAPPTRTRSAPHPRFTLAQAEDMGRKAFDKGARRLRQDFMATEMGYKNAVNGSYVALRSAASHFGIIESGDDFISVAEPWISAFHDGDEAALMTLRKEAMQKPDLYATLIGEFNDGQLPSLEKLTRHLFLNPKYGILKDAAAGAAKVFLESARHAGMVDDNKFLRLAPPPAADSTVVANPGKPPAQGPDIIDARTRSKTFETIIIPAGLDRVEVKLVDGQRAFIFVPVPLAKRDKLRLKQYIDLVLDEEIDERIDSPSSTVTDATRGS